MLNFCTIQQPNSRAIFNYMLSISWTCFIRMILKEDKAFLNTNSNKNDKNL